MGCVLLSISLSRLSLSYLFLERSHVPRSGLPHVALLQEKVGPEVGHRYGLIIAEAHQTGPCEDQVLGRLHAETPARRDRWIQTGSAKARRAVNELLW